MLRIRRWTMVVATVLLAAVLGFGQAPAKKSYVFKGKVEKVNKSDKSLTVNGQAVKGWMEAMTMDYPVDDAAVLNKVKVGDQISATVYDGEMTLHKVMVQVAPKSEGKAKKK